MVRHSEFVRFVLDHLGPVGGIRARAMFGGFGIYRGDIMFAIIAADRLFLKADDASRREFESQGLSPFTYVARGKTMTLSYYEAHPEFFESEGAMRHWTERAVAAAMRAKTRAPSKRARRRSPQARRD